MPANPSKDLLVITSASGKQTGALLPLITNWENLRLIVNSPSSQQKLQASYHHASVQTADLSNPSDCARILEGATCVYHIGPTFHPHETEIGYNMIDAAAEQSKNGQLKHFVYSSVLNTQLRKLLNHDVKRFVEEYLMESGLDYTVLKPSHFIDPFPIAEILAEKKVEVVHYAQWDPEIGFSFIALQDLAAAAKKVLEERENHFWALYPLVGVEKMSYAEVCKVIGEVIRKKIVVRQSGFEEAVNSMLSVLFGEEARRHPKRIDGVERLFLYYNRHGLVGNKNVLEWLIGRKAVGISSWAEQRKKELA